MKEEKAKLVDPVTDDEKKAAEATLDGEAKTLSIDALSLNDFKPVPVTASRQAHPFEGYPQKKIKIGTYEERGKTVDLMVNASAIVALNPKEFIFQDPSGENMSIVSGGQEKIVTLKTYHNRVVRGSNGRNLDIVFDRIITLGDGRKMENVALVPDHQARAQIMFTVNKKTGKVEVDRRYLMADIEQVSRLRRTFEMFHYQQTQSERLSERFYQEPESRAS